MSEKELPIQDSNGTQKEDSEKKEDIEETENVESSEIKVNSANDWEHADLGDQSRKDKFLKLMGAAKGDHTGKIVIGEQASKHKGDDPEKMNKNLEEQFQHGLEQKLKSGFKGHRGFGFTKEEETAGTDSPSNEPAVDATPDTDVVEERRRVTDDNSAPANEPPVDGATTEKRSSNTDEGATTVPKKKPMMTFVKASDS